VPACLRLTPVLRPRPQALSGEAGALDDAVVVVADGVATKDVPAGVAADEWAGGGDELVNFHRAAANLPVSVARTCAAT